MGRGEDVGLEERRKKMVKAWKTALSKKGSESDKKKLRSGQTKKERGPTGMASKTEAPKRKREVLLLATAGQATNKIDQGVKKGHKSTGSITVGVGLESRPKCRRVKLTNQCPEDQSLAAR